MVPGTLSTTPGGVPTFMDPPFDLSTNSIWPNFTPYTTEVTLGTVVEGSISVEPSEYARPPGTPVAVTAGMGRSLH